MISSKFLLEWCKNVVHSASHDLQRFSVFRFVHIILGPNKCVFVKIQKCTNDEFLIMICPEFCPMFPISGFSANVCLERAVVSSNSECIFGKHTLQICFEFIFINTISIISYILFSTSLSRTILETSVISNNGAVWQLTYNSVCNGWHPYFST